MTNYTIKDLQKRLLELLVFFHKYCEEHNFKYIVIGGTCLGAIRHKGFIPWDDDVDVAMPRQEYNAFVDECKKNGLPKGLSFQVYGKCEPHYNDNWVRIRMDETLYVIPYHEKLGWKHLGVFLDIFPYEPTSSSDIKKIKKIKRKYDFIARCFSNKVAPCLPTLKSKLFRLVLFGVNKTTLNKKRENIYKKMINPSKDIVHYVDLNTKYGLSKGIYPPTIFEKRMLTVFENTLIYVPCDYDLFLTIQFGDYHKLPPEEERVGHLPKIIKL